MEREERSVLSRARPVKGPGDELLPDASLPHDQDASLLVPQELDGVEKARHGGGLTDDSLIRPRAGSGASRKMEARRLFHPFQKGGERAKTPLKGQASPRGRRRQLDNE